MCRLLLLLLLAALNSASTAPPPEDSTGVEFRVAFPENIAYYHPVVPTNNVQVTALYDNTVVVINGSAQSTLAAGKSLNFQLKPSLELGKQALANNTVIITSNKNITVTAVSVRNNSVQTGLVISTDKLATNYIIPLTPKITGTTDPTSLVTEDVTERNPFHLIIINTNSVNQVTIKGEVNSQVTLQPNEIAQIWINDTMQTVNATQPVKVLFGHSCAIWVNCTCGLLYTSLQPAKEQAANFYIPPGLVGKADDQTFILVSETGSSQMQPFNLNSPMVTTSGTAILYRPGLLINLIADTDFASCTVVKSFDKTQTFVVIVVNSVFSNGVYIGNVPLVNPQWQPLAGTGYVSTQVDLKTGESVIWHNSSVMAVYFMGYNGSTLFGNPAPIISKSPDFRGCVLSPEVMHIGAVASSWQESVQYCSNHSLQLISLPTAQLEQQIYNNIMQTKNDTLQEVWLGMRRSSQNGSWYWVDTTPVNYTNWAAGEPGTVLQGQCATLRLTSDTDFGWSDNNCCNAIHPICYKQPILFPIPN